MEVFLAVLLSVVASDGPVASNSNELAPVKDHHPASSHRIPVAVLDVAKVFKEAQAFNEKMQAIKLEIADFDRRVKATRDEQSDQSPPDPKSFAVKKAAFLADEAQAYAETYRQIQDAVQKICKERDIGVVIRATTESMDPNDRNSVLQAVNRPIVFTSVPDLTGDVIAALKKSSQ